MEASYETEEHQVGEVIVKEQGRYRVFIPRVGRQRQDRYIDISADGPEFAIQKVIDLLDRDERYGWFRWDYEDDRNMLKIIKTWRKPVFETTEDKAARTARAIERAKAARARRA